MNAVGGCLWYLQYLKLDQEMVSMRNWNEYLPHSHQQVGASALILDGVTLANLEILENNRDKTQEGE